jgi:hypothetical protein
MTLAARQIFLDELRQCPSPFDVIVVDEAHHLAEPGSRTKRLAFAGVYRKRLGSSVAALRATLRRRLDLPPASEDADEAVPFVDTDASDPEDDIIDPGVASEAPPPPLDPREAELAQAVLSAAAAVPEGRDSKLQALKRLLAGEVAVGGAARRFAASRRISLA